ncbi:MAG TPA: type VI secretion system baseplate subunit TssG, partial [Acidobacteriaceae bacterium]|nr:type VI secretion system baseplate subunit TssG [Acidobacteriaceae bacterium]
GPLGTLPQLYTEQAIHQRFAGDASYAAFFDIFHDRLLRLFYRAWSKPRLYLAYDRPRLPHAERHPLARYLFALIGMGTPGLEERLPFRDEALLRYPGLLAQRPRSAECLRAMLEDFFGVPVRVEQFVGRWHSLEPEECCALGMGETNAQLGLGCVAGDAVWTRSAMVRIALGPLTAKQFHSFLPDADGFATITGLTRWFLGQGLSFALQPALAAGQTPEWMELANDGDAGPRLGWNTWLSEEAFATPALDAVFGEEESLEGIRTWH